MVILTILLSLIVLCIFIFRKYQDDYRYEGWVITAFCTIFIAGIFLLFHILGWALSSYDYRVFETERNSFQQTLEQSRKNQNVYESAAILKEVADWNAELAKLKYQNTLWLMDDYIDDRIEDLQPIN